MAKTAEELNTLKEKYQELRTQLSELSEDELDQVTGGSDFTDLWEKMKDIGKKMHTTTQPVVKTILPSTPNNGSGN